MGNTQSATEDQRVAKPQTIRITRSTKSFSPSSQVNDASADHAVAESASSDSPSLMASPTFDSITEDEFRHQVRAQFLSPDHGSGQTQRHPQVDLLAVNVARSLSRSGSRNSQSVSAKSSLARLQNGSQLSVATDKAVDLHSAIAILQELRKTASPEDMAALHQALLPVPSRDSLSRSPTDDSQDEMDPATRALIRRKSFAQPGVATRHAKPESTIKRKSVPAPVARAPVWRKEMMGASPLARLSSLDGLDPPPTIHENRAQTPSDLEYSQLGNLKHGSLMVMNGPPSPVPSTVSPERMQRKVSDDRDEDFFTASERGSVDSRPSSRHAQANLWDSDNEHAGTARQTRPHERTEPAKFGGARRDGSPLKQELQFEAPVAQLDFDAESVYSKHVRPSKSLASLRSPPAGRFSFDGQNAGDEHHLNTMHVTGPSQSAISLASAYISEMPPSPYKKSTVQEDEEPVSPIDEGFYESPQSDIRNQIIEMPPLIGQDTVQISPRKPLRSHPTLETIPKLNTATPKRPVGVKTDSGYSSSASTSVVDSMSPLEMHQPNLSTVESLADISPPPRFYASKQAVDLAVRIGQISSQRSTPDTDAASDSIIIIESIEKDPTKEEKLKRSKSWRKSVRKSLPRLRSSETAPVLPTDSRAKSEGVSSTPEYKPKKLQKRRPLSQPPINLADRHVLDKSIPRIPSKVFSRHSGRLSIAPSMQHLEETYGDLRETSESPASTSRPSLPSCFFPDAEDAPPPAPPAHRMSFARRSFRRARTQVDEQEILYTGIADFGTVSQSLGTSPYDAAIPNPRIPMPGSATQPHNVSTRAPRTGPREGWDAETASKIAQMRSKERAAQRTAWQEQNYERRPIPPRPVSYHEEMPARVSRPPDATMPRPKSMHAHRAPVPAPASVPSAPPPPPPHRFEQMPAQDRFFPIQPPTVQSRPRTAHERDPSPVKNLVNAFEHRASLTQAPPPMPAPQPQPQPDWTDSSRLWRERRLNAAQTSIVTSSSQKGHTMTTTTTTITTFDATPRDSRPAIQNRKSMPQMRQPSPEAPSRFDEEGTLGRYSGGGGRGNLPYYGTEAKQARHTYNAAHRDMTPSSNAARRLYGIDFGDVPFRVI